MLVNQRVREVRRLRRLESRELAKLARISPAALSQLESEKKVRTPRIDTLQKLALALDVTTGFLLGEEDSDVPLSQALARQSLKVFLRTNQISSTEEAYLMRIILQHSAPDTVKGWTDLLANLKLFKDQFSASDANSS